MALVNYRAAVTLHTLPFLFYKRNSIIIPLANTSLEMERLNNFKIYGDEKVVEQIMRLVNGFLFIWESMSFVHMSLEQ